MSELFDGTIARRERRRRRRRRAAGSALVALVVGVNAAAWAHAGAFTTFAETHAERTPPVQALGVGERLRALLTGVSLPRPTNERTPADLGLAFETHRVHARDGVGLELWRVPHPSPRAVAVLCHGHAGSKAALLEVALELRRLDLEVVLVDLRGSGGSDGVTTTLGVAEALDVAAAVERARALAPGRPLLLHGASMGAAAALRAVHAHGVAPDALLLEAPFDRLVTTVEHRFEAMGFPGWAAWAPARLLVFWGGVRHGFDALGHAPVEYAASARCPTLLMGGADDPWVRPDELRAVGAALRGPKEVLVLEGVAHESLLGARPDAWRAAVRRLVDLVAPGGAAPQLAR
jgi:alpha-beta hydrolase superfamily lysophospholipase